MPKTILTFIGYYLPGYRSGGPVRTISNMLNLLGDKYTFKIITRDRDQLDDRPYENIKTNQWNDGVKSEIFYKTEPARRGGNQALRTVINNCEFDQYYLNSIFDFNYSIKIILLYNFKLIPQKPILLAPRGELLPGALSLKTFKKNLFLSLVKVLGLYKNVIWHASTEEEAKEIKRKMGENVNYKVALDVPDYSLLERKVERTHIKEKDKLRILYLSSIVPKKNLKFAIEVLNEIKGDFALDIYGPIKDIKYWNECLKEINHEIKDRVVYKGEIHNDEIDKVYSNYDLFFFPTLSENFGHVVWESLAFGCPVLTTDTTPWYSLEKFNAGWNFKLSEFDRFVDLIKKIILLNNIEYDKFFVGCGKYVDDFHCNNSYKANNFKLFE